MRKEVILKVISGINLLLQVCIVLALDPRMPIDFYRHHIWTVEEGLPMNSVYAVAQTSDGYIWVGTETGLACFDGVEFDVFSRENTPELLNDLVLSLAVDLKGALWIGTRGGGITRYQEGVFRTFTKEQGLLSNEAWALLATGDGALWIGARNGLNRFWEGKISAIPLPGKLSEYNIRALMEDRLGRIWVGTRGVGLLLVEKRGDRFETKFQGLAGQKITALLQDRAGDIWVGTTESGLIRFQDNQPFYYNTRNGLATNYISCLLEDQSGNLWIGAHGSGIFVLKNGKTRFSRFDSRQGLSGNVVCTFYEDRDRTVWIGTEGGGLNSLGDTRITSYSMKNGLSCDIISAIFQDHRGNTWIGNMGSGIDYLNPLNNQVQSITTREGMPAYTVVSIAEHPDGRLWFGTLGGGVNRFTLENKKFDIFTTREGLSDNFVRALYVDPAGNLWAGTDTGGVHHFSNGRFTSFANVRFRVNTILKDSRGRLWVGTWGNGLALLQNGNTRIYNREQGLPDNIIMAIYEDTGGALWIGTYSGGLVRFQEDKFAKIGNKDGLPDNTIYCILEDQEHYLWMSSNHGIFYAKRKELEDFCRGKIKRISTTLLTTEDGMKSSECNGGHQPSGWKTREGKLWFPTTKGVSVVDPENIGIDTPPPPVLIKKVIIDGISYDIGNKATAPPGKGALEIHYTGINFTAPKKILFKYKIDELDEQWVDAGMRRTVNYVGIPPGDYRFRVIACNSGGAWNNNGAYFDFYLKPRYYQTLVFKIFFPIGVILIFALLYRFVLSFISLQRQKRKYKGSYLNPQEAKEYLQKMLYLVEVEKVFSDADISLHSLAEKLATSPRNLSQIINEQLGKNFYEFINEYRVNEAKKILVSPRSGQLSVLEIGHRVGFNSKSAFNRAFKQFTHMTPTQFKKKIVAKEFY